MSTRRKGRGSTGTSAVSGANGASANPSSKPANARGFMGGSLRWAVRGCRQGTVRGGRRVDGRRITLPGRVGGAQQGRALLDACEAWHEYDLPPIAFLHQPLKGENNDQY